MNSVSFVFSFILAICLTLSALVQGIVAFREIKNHSSHPKGWIISISICVILAIISGSLSSYTSSHQNAPSPTSTPNNVILSTPLTGSPSPTLHSQSTPTPTSVPQITPTSLATNRTITENRNLTCSTCDSGDPIHFTIDSVTIDNSNGRTLWNITLTNISADSSSAFDKGISLEAPQPSQPVQATGYWSDGLFNKVFINVGQKVEGQLIFTFPVYTGVAYTFSAQLSTDYNEGIEMPFDDARFTF